MAPSRNDETAGKKRIPFFLVDFIRLARQKRFVDLNVSFKHRRIRTNLLAGRKKHDIVLHQFFRRDLAFFSVAHDDCMRSVQQVHFVKRFFCAPFLNDSDDDVPQNNRQKGQIAKRSDDAQKHRDHQEDQVEIRQSIAQNDLLDGQSGRSVRLIGFSGVDSFLDFFLSQATVSSIFHPKTPFRKVSN